MNKNFLDGTAETFDQSLQKDNQFTQDIQTIREEALNSHLAGTDYSTLETPKQVEQKVDVETPDITSSFSMRDQVMSKLNLIDPQTLDYTDSYTNYINKGGQPLPGFEQAHQQILDIERAESTMKEVDQGLLSYDDALVSLYAKDILETMGYNIRSVGWWQSKYKANDFSNPLKNKYIMDSVIQQADQYHQAKMTSSYAHSQVKSTALGSMVGQSLSNQRIEQLFPSITKVADNMKEDVQSVIHSSFLDSSMRLATVDGKNYYLHTDGKLYELDNQKAPGNGYANYKEKDGQITEINITGMPVVLSSFKSGVASVFTSLLTLATSVGGVLWESTGGLFDGKWEVDDAFQLTNNLDQWINKNAGWLVNSNRIDLDGFQVGDAGDWTATISSVMGSVVGGMGLGALGGKIAQAGSTLANTANASKFTVFGGKALRLTGNLVKYQTGNWGTGTMGMTRPQLWFNHMKTTGTYAVKNLLQDVNTMSRQRMMLEDPSSVTDGDIIKRALLTNSVNFAIDTLISGGVDDNIWQRYTGRNTVSKEATSNLSKFFKDATYYEKNILSRTQDIAPEVSRYLSSQNWVVRFNTAADIISNYTTAIVSRNSQIDKDGKLKDFQIDFSNSADLMARAAITGYWYTHRSQKKAYNVAFENIQSIHQNVLNELDTKIANTTDDNNRQKLERVKAEYLEEYNAQPQDLPAEAKIIASLENLYKANPEFIQSITDKTLTPKKLEVFRQMYDEAETMYQARRTESLKYLQEHQSKGIKKLTSTLTQWLKGNNEKFAMRAERSRTVFKMVTDQEIQERANYITHQLLGSRLMDSMNSIDKLVPNDQDTGVVTSIRTLEDFKDDNEMIQKINSAFPEASGSAVLYTVQNNKQNESNFKETLAAYKYAASIGLVKEVDAGSNTFGMLENDFFSSSVDASMMNSFIKGFNTLIGYSSVEDKAKMIDLMIGVTNNGGETDAPTKSNTALNLLSINQDNISLHEGARLYQELINKGIIQPSVSNQKRFNNLINKYESAYKVIEALTLANSEPEKLRTQAFWGQPGIKEAVTDLIKEKSLPSDIHKVLETEFTKVAKASFQSSGGNQYQKYFYNTAVDFALPLASEEEISRLMLQLDSPEGQRGIEEYADIYMKQTFDENTPEKVKNKVIEAYNRMYEFTKAQPFNGDDVIIDINSMVGSETNKFRRQMLARSNSSNMKNFSDSSGYSYDKFKLSQELRFHNELVGPNNPGMIRLDITTESGIKEFNDIMSRFNYDIKLDSSDPQANKDKLATANISGLLYRDVNWDVLDIKGYNPEVAYTKIKNILETNLLPKEWGGGKLYKTKTYSLDGKDMGELDAVQFIMNAYDLKNISPALRASLADASLIKLLPFAQQNEYNTDTLIYTIAEYGSLIKLKAGKIAGDSANRYNENMEAAVVKMVKTDKELATFFANKIIADDLIAKGDVSLPINVTYGDLRTFSKAGIISLNNDDNGAFWKVQESVSFQGSSDDRTKQVTLVFDAGKAEDLKQYLYNKDFNLLKMLPFLSNVDSSREVEEVLHQFVDSKGLLNKANMLPGTRKSIYSTLFNIEFPWDDQQNTFKTQYLNEILTKTQALKHGETFLSNYEKNKNKYTEYLEPTTFKTMDEMIAWSKKHKNSPEADLLGRYVKAFNDTTYAKDGEQSEDWRLLIKNRRVVEKLSEAKELTPELIKDIQGFYSDATYKASSSSTRIQVPTAGEYAAGSIPVGSKVIINALGGIDNFTFVDTDGKIWVPSPEVIREAYNMAKVAQEEGSARYASTYSDYFVQEYVDDDRTKLISMLAGGQGNIRIEDADEVLRIITENENFARQLFDESVYNELVRTLTKQVSRNKAFYDQAKNFVTMERIEGLPKQPTHFVNSDISMGRFGGGNFEDQETLLQNKINKGLTHKDSAFAKLNDDVMNEGKYEQYTRKARKNRVTDMLFNVANTRDALVANIAEENGLVLNMNNAIKTAFNLENSLRAQGVPVNSEMRENLLESARHMINMSQGLQYVNERIKFVSIDNEGKLTGLEAATRKNYSDETLDDVYKLVLNNKDRLLGTNLLVLDKQDINNNSGVPFKVIPLKTEMDINKIQSILTRNFFQEHESTIKNIVKDPNSSIDSIIGNMTNEDFVRVMNESALFSVGELESTNLFYDAVKSNGNYIDKEAFYRMLKLDFATQGGYVDKNKKNIAIRNFVAEKTGGDIEDIYNSGSHRLRTQVDALLFGFVPEYLSDRQKEDINKVRSALLETVPELSEDLRQDVLEYSRVIGSGTRREADLKKNISDYFLLSTTSMGEALKDAGLADSKVDDTTVASIITGLIASSTKAEDMNYFINNTSMKSLKVARDTGDVSVNIQSRADGSTIDLDTLRRTIQSAMGESSEETPYKYVVTFDNETSNKMQENQNRSDFIFSTAFSIKYKDADGTWKTKNIRAFLDHGVSPKQWIDQNIDKTDSFFRNNKGYQDDVKEYSRFKTGTEVISDEVIFTTPDKLRLMLEPYMNKEAMFVGYNSDKSDLVWLRNAGIFGDNMKDTTLVDAIYLANASTIKDKGQVSVSLTNLLDKVFGNDKSLMNSAHGALADAENTFKILKPIIENQLDISKISTIGIKNIEKLLNSLGVELNDSIINKVDQNLDKMKAMLPELYGSEEGLPPRLGTFVQSIDNVSMIKQGMEQYLDRELSRTIWELNEYRRKDIGLKDSSYKILENNAHNNMKDIMTYIQDKTIVGGIKKDLPTLVSDISRIMRDNPEDWHNTNRVLELLGTELGHAEIITAINNRYGTKLSLEDFKAYKESEDFKINRDTFSKSLEFDYKNSPIVNSSVRNMIDTYEDLRGTGGLLMATRQMLKDLGIQDERILNHLANGFTTAYDFTEGVDVDAYLKTDGIDKVETPFTKALDEYYSKNFKMPDALISTKVNGIYDLISSFNYGSKQKNLLTGNTEILDSSCIVLTKKSFEDLVKKDYYQYMTDNKLKELYTILMVHPADKASQLLPRRVVVVDSDDYGIQLPETLSQVLLARDFDGDHVVVTEPNLAAQDYMKATANIAYKVHDIQEALFDELKKSDIIPKEALDVRKEIAHIYGNPEVLRISNNLDELLRHHGGDGSKAMKDSEYKELKTAFIAEMNRLGYKNGSEMFKAIDYKYEDHSDKVAGLRVWYVDNPYITGDDSISFRNRRLVKEAVIPLSRQYSLIDSITGVQQKAMLQDVEAERILEPLKQLTINSIFASDLVRDYIESATDINKLAGAFEKAYNTVFPDNGTRQDEVLHKAGWNNFKEVLDEEAKAKKPNFDKISREFHGLLVATEEYIRRKESNNKKVLTAIKSMKDNNQLEKELSIKEKGVDLYNQSQLYNMEFASLGGFKGQDPAVYYLNKQLEQMSLEEDTVRLRKDIKRDKRDMSIAFVMLNPPISSDAIGVNKNSKNPLKAFRAEEIAFNTRKELASITIDGKTRKIKEGDTLEAGQEIIKGVKLENKVKIAYIDKVNRTIHTLSEKDLDPSLKLITDSGAKGATHYLETDSDIDLLLTKDGLKASRFLRPGVPIIPDDAEIVTKKVKYMSNEYSVRGFYIKDVVANIVEDTSQWSGKNRGVNAESKEYNVDYLHFASDGKAIAGPAMFGSAMYTIKDGEVVYDPTRLKDLVNKVDHPERRVSAHNVAGTLQQMRMGMLLSNMTDKEIQEYFNTDKTTAINNLTRSKLAVTFQYEGMINYLLKNVFKGNRLKQLKENNPTAKKFFSPEIYKLFMDFQPTQAGNIDTSSVDSGRRRRDALLKMSQQDFNRYSQSVLTNPTASDLDDRTIMHLEEIYMTALQLHRYIFDDKFKASQKQYIEWTKRGLLGYGRVLKDTSLNKLFRRQNVDYAIKRADAAFNSNVLNDDVKSGLTMKPFLDQVLSTMDVKPSLTSNPQYIQELSSNAYNPALMKAITKNLYEGDNTYTGYNNDAMVWQTMLGLGKIKPGMNKYDKASMIGNDARGRLYNLSLSRPIIKFTEDGTPYYTLSDSDSKNVTAAEHIKNINSTLKDFNYMYRTLQNKDDIIGEGVDVEKLRLSNKEEDLQRYKKIEEDNKQIEESLNKILGVIANRETGEISDTNVLDYHNEAFTKSKVNRIKLSYENDSEPVIKEDKLLMSRSGLKLDSPEAVAIDASYKTFTSTATYISQEPLIKLAELERSVKRFGMSQQDFEDMALYNQLKASLEISKLTKNKDDFDKRMSWIVSNRGDFSELEERVTKNIIPRYSEVARLYDSYIEDIRDLSVKAQQVTGEPFGTMVTMFAPFKPKDKEINNAVVVSTIKNILNFDMYDHTDSIKSNMMFDFWNSSETMVRELSKLIALENLSDTFESRGLISNEKIVDNVSSLIDKRLSVSDYKKDYWVKDDSIYREQQEQIVDIIGQYTKLNTVSFKRKYPTIDGLYKALYEQLSLDTDVLIDNYNTTMGTRYRAYSDFTKGIENSKSSIDRQQAEVVANYMFAKLQVVQGMLETSKSMTNNLANFISSVSKEGYSFVNKFGQRYERDGVVKPLTSTSMSHLIENAGISYNSKNETQWNQFMLEKMINGEIYLMKNELVDHLDKHVYTTKLPGRTLSTLKEISKWSSALQMALPTKLINRLISFTGFDYAMGALYSPKVLGKIGQARREILAAYTSKGATMSPELIEYFSKEGQPLGIKGRDPVTFQEDMKGAAMDYLSKITEPLQIQNHLGRYAIYLAAKESFDKGDPWYGPTYKYKEGIDALDDNSDKAMMIMDYMLGSPGGFPMLSKKTSGLMLYATFPMNLTRTLGAWGMSMAKLASEGFTSENSRHWMRTAITPSLGLMGITALGSLLISWICDLYDVDKETEEKWLKQKVTIDPLGTLLGGTPTVSGSDINPLKNIEEMFITPFTDTRNDNIFKKLFGVINSNVLSHLNPAIKIPTEVATGKDLYGAVPFDTKYYYTNTENAIRKTLGFFIGSGISNSIVNQFKIDEYKPDSSFIDSLNKGITKGIQNDLGNQKSYKKDVSNYYSMINSVKNFKEFNDNYEDSEIADLISSEYMGTKRSYSSYYGAWSKEDYSRINNTMKTMMRNKVSASQVYQLIADEYNKGVSEATLRSVLNNNSIVRKLQQTDYTKYVSTLDSKQKQKLQQAINYEKEMYPMLEDFFPNSEDNYQESLKKPYYKRIYNSDYDTQPRNYVPYVRYPQRYYPNTYSYRRKTQYNPNYNKNKTTVKVSPQMAIWNKDYNLTPYKPDLSPFYKSYKGSGLQWR